MLDVYVNFIVYTIGNKQFFISFWLFLEARDEATNKFEILRKFFFIIKQDKQS